MIRGITATRGTRAQARDSVEPQLLPRLRFLMLRVSSLGSAIRKNSDIFEPASHRNSCEFRYKTVLAQHQNLRFGLR